MSSYLFDDNVLGWAAKRKTSKKKNLKVIKIYGLCKVLINGQNKKNQIKIEKIKI